MRLLKIQEFALSTVAEYRHPVAFSDAKLSSVAKALALEPCGDYLNPIDISLAKQNDLFAYTLSVPLINGAANIAINAQGITVSFKQGRTKDHLDLMLRLTLAAMETAKVGEVKRSLISFSAHAVFQSTSDYAEHMKRFTALAPDVVSGGMVLVRQMPEIEGELRYASEKSLVCSDALFFAVNAVCARDVNIDLFETLAKQFEATAALEGFDFMRTKDSSR